MGGSLGLGSPKLLGSLIGGVEGKAKKHAEIREGWGTVGRGLVERNVRDFVMPFAFPSFRFCPCASLLISSFVYTPKDLAPPNYVNVSVRFHS